MARHKCMASVGPWTGVVLVVGLALVGASEGPPLIEAVKGGEVATVRQLLARPAVNVNAAAPDGATALHWAVHNDDLALVDLLLRAGAQVARANRYGVKPLSLAAENGNAAITERLLEAGADPNTLQPGGESVLMTAARTGEPATLRVLLARGADVNHREDTRQQTALMWAAARGNTAAVELLLAAGADLRARSVEHKEVFENTFLAGRRTPATGEELPMFTALLFAVRAGQTEAARVLLEHGADPNTSVSDGTTALHIACLNAQWDMGALLLAHGADPNAAAVGFTPLHVVARTRTAAMLFKGGGLAAPVGRGTLTSLDLAKQLLAAGADINAQVTKLMDVQAPGERTSVIGATPLMIAANPPDPEMGRLLLAHGADPTIPAADGTTTLNAAAGEYYQHPIGGDEEALEFVKIMADAGVDVNRPTERGRTALHNAAARGYNPLVQFLADRGATLDARSQDGRTPLMVANLESRSGALYEHPETVALLKTLYEAQGLSTALPTHEEAVAQLVRPRRLELVCPAAQTVTSPDGGPVQIAYGAATLRGGESPATITCTPASGTAFPLGVTTVTCRAASPEAREQSCAVLMRVVVP